jgi:hypothetical protein
VSGVRNRPVSWSRRLEAARAARARVLAARDAGEADPVHVPEAAASGEAGHAGGVGAHGEARRPPRSRAGLLRWLVVAGFIGGVAAGAVAVAILVRGVSDVPPDPEPPPADTASEVEPAISPEAPARSTPPPVEDVADPNRVAEGVPAMVPPAPAVSAADLARDAARRAVEAGEPEPGVRPAETDGAIPEPVGPSASATESVTPELLPDPGTVEPMPAAEDAGDPDAGTPEEVGVTDPPTTAPEPEPEPAAPEVVETVEADARPLAEPETPSQASVAPAPAEEPVLPSPSEPATVAPPPEPSPPTAPPAEAEVAALADSGDAGDSGVVPAAPVGFLRVHAAPLVSSEDLEEVLATLTAAGYAVEQTVRVDFRISQTNVRYFHAEDAMLAAGVAEAIAGSARDFTDYRPSPDPGTIEVWLEG